MRSTLLKFGKGFRVAFDVRQIQAAEMVIAPGGHEGGPDNRHRGSDQWLFVVAGTSFSRSANPYPFARTVRPFFTTATETPAVRCAATAEVATDST